MIPVLCVAFLISSSLFAFYYGKYGELYSQWQHDTEGFDAERERFVAEIAALKQDYKEEHDRVLARNGYRPILEKNQPQAAPTAPLDGLQGVFASTRGRIREELDRMTEEEKAELNGNG